MTLIFTLFALLLFAAAIHPFVTYPLTLRALAANRVMKVHQGVTPKRIAVCVCAYNEADVIGERAENLIAQRGDVPDLDVLFYVDASTDRTAEILQAFGDRIKLVVASARHGKTYGMNLLTSMTDAEIVVYSDANVAFAPNAISQLVAPFADPNVGCCCGHLRYKQPGQEIATATAEAGSLYWRLEEYIKQLESDTGSVMGADGSIFAIRRSLHRPPPPDLIDDMYVSLSVMCDGARIVRVPNAVAYEDAVTRPAEEFWRKVRISCQAFNVNRALWPRLMALPPLDRYKYISHKLLRWLSIYFLAASGLCLLMATMLIEDAALTGAFVFAAIASGSMLFLARSGPVGKVREILAAMVATGLGVWRSIRGQRFQTWNPPASARQAVPRTAFIGE